HGNASQHAATARPAKPPEDASAAKAGRAAEPSTTAGTYYVQVGSFSSEQNAADVQRELGRSGYTSRLNASSVRGRIWYRVQVGPFRTGEAANRARQRLARQGHANARVLPPGAP
ncbi:MAG TPA: SPOR domain-containing protein, partial [Nevskiaceae bacterium]